MKKKVLFTQDFADKKVGDEFECNSMLASQLVRKDKVAEFVSESDSDLSLKDLRLKYPEIKASSKGKFLELLKG